MDCNRFSGWVCAPALLLAVSGLASSAYASFTIQPTDVITWGGTGVGRSVNGAPSGFTWGNTANGFTTPLIDSSGRVYYVQQFSSSPQVGTLATTNNKGMFTATNSTDSTVFQNIADCNAAGWVITGTTMNPGNAAHSSQCVTNPPANMRVSGTQVAIGVQVNGSGINESGTSQNNSVWFSGTSGGVSNAAQRNDAVTLNNTVGSPATGNVNTDYKALAVTSSDLNSSGTSLLALTVATSSNFTSTSGTGNNAFLATKSSSGYKVIGQGNQAAPNTGGTYFNSSSGGVGDSYFRLNRNGQAAFGARLNDAGTVTTANDRVAYIYTPGSTPTYSMVYRNGDTAYGIGGQAFMGGTSVALNGGSTVKQTFSNAGLMYFTPLSGSDISTSGSAANNQAIYLATNSTLGATNADRATNNTLVARRGNAAPALDITTGASTTANTFCGSVSFVNTLNLNNGGYMAWEQGLQGVDVTATTGVVAGSTLGNDHALMVGTAGNISMLARQGDAAPGFANEYFLFGPSSGITTVALNNSNQILFDSGLSFAQAGGTISTVDSRKVLWGWQPGLAAPYAILASGDSVQVDTGVFKTISSFALNANDNGDGGALGFNDNGQFILSVTFTDSTFGVVKLAAVPAPGTGALAIMGLGMLARRKRR